MEMIGWEEVRSDGIRMVFWTWINIMGVKVYDSDFKNTYTIQRIQ